MEYVSELARIQLRFFVGEPPRCSSSCGRGISLLAKGRFRLFCPLPAPPALTLSRMCAFTLPALMLRAGADGVLSASGCGKAAHRHTL